MRASILVPAIMVPIYTIGYIIVGILGYLERGKSSRNDEGMLITQDFSDLGGALLTTTTEDLRRISNPDSRSTSVYFRTDTLFIPDDKPEEKRCCNLSAEFKDTVWTLYEDLCIFPMPLLNMLDHVSDITMTVHFLSKDETRNLGVVSLLILVLFRFASAFILGDHYGWKTGVRQFFDIEVFFAMYHSVRRHRTLLQVIQLKILEGFYESFPELCIQTYYLVKDSHENEGDGIIYLSITLSLLSLSKCWLFSDEVAISWRGLHWRFSEENSNEQKISTGDDGKSFSCSLCMLIMWVWRFGEVSTMICVLIAFANVISAKGTWILFGLLLLSTYVVQRRFWPQSREATWFYQVSKDSRTSALLSVSSSSVGSFDIMEDIASFSTNFWKDCKDAIWFYCKYMYRVFILIVLWLAEVNYSFWALPTFYPSRFVKMYYVIKVLLLVAMLTACIVSQVNKGSRGFRMLSDEIFNELWYYFIIGISFFIFGGITTWLFVLDIEQYKKALEADPNFLLKMIEQKQWILIERLVRNGVVSAFKIIEDANAWMIEHKVVPTDEEAMETFATDEAYCKLLYYLIKSKLIRIGPRDMIISPSQVIFPKWYKKWAVPGLVWQCNHSREKTTRSYLATTVLSKLVEKRNFHCIGSRRLLHYGEIRDAGASLKFLRYHLNAPEYLFKKHGALACTAKQLYSNGFDLLFCIRADFTREELSLAGFDDKVLSNIFVMDKNEYGDWPSELEHLQRLKQSGFKEFHKLNFTFEELRAADIFTASELLRYKQGFMLSNGIILTESPTIQRGNSASFLRASTDETYSSRPTD